MHNKEINSQYHFAIKPHQYITITHSHKVSRITHQAILFSLLFPNDNAEKPRNEFAKCEATISGRKYLWIVFLCCGVIALMDLRERHLSAECGKEWKIVFVAVIYQGGSCWFGQLLVAGVVVLCVPKGKGIFGVYCGEVVGRWFDLFCSFQDWWFLEYLYTVVWFFYEGQGVDNVKTYPF